MGDITIGEVVKLRRRTASIPRALRELEAANQEVQRLRQKLDRRKRKKENLRLATSKSEKKSVEEVSLSSSAVSAQRSGHFKQQEFSLPDSWTSLKPSSEASYQENRPDSLPRLLPPRTSQFQKLEKKEESPDRILSASSKIKI